MQDFLIEENVEEQILPYKSKKNGKYPGNA
jgi:hypothetical protein